MLNHKHWHYDLHSGWQPLKASKLDVLGFIKDREVVTATSLMNEFGYTLSSAKCRLSQLHKERYIESYCRGQWCLTQRGWDKVDYVRSSRKKRERESELQRLQMKVAELERHVHVVRDRLAWMSREIRGVRAPFQAKRDDRSRLALVLAEVDKLMKQLAAAA